jgi:8-oxo-dGTP pyrophosphatase MutT (NUDIX family)
LRNHSGEVSLPGGSFDPADGTMEQTALREAWEELGVPPERVDIVAALSPVWIPVSNFRITPFVGFMPERPPFKLAAGEVAALIETPLSALRRPDVLQGELREVRGRHLHVPYFAIDDYKVWGATALVLAEFVARVYPPENEP